MNIEEVNTTDDADVDAEEGDAITFAHVTRATSGAAAAADREEELANDEEEELEDEEEEEEEEGNEKEYENEHDYGLAAEYRTWRCSATWCECLYPACWGLPCRHMLRLYMQQNLTQIPEEAIAGLWWNVGDSDAVRLRVEELPNTQQNTRKKRRSDADLTGSDMADLLTKKFRSGVLAWGKHSKAAFEYAMDGLDTLAKELIEKTAGGNNAGGGASAGDGGGASAGAGGGGTTPFVANPLKAPKKGGAGRHQEKRMPNTGSQHIDQHRGTCSRCSMR